MNYQFDFLAVWDFREQLLSGVFYTLGLTALGAVLGVSLGLIGAVVRAWKLQPFSVIVGFYVEFIRNTPFIVQLFFIFFGLPSLGLRLTELQASLIAVVINLGAYSTEILRSGIVAIPKGQLEASLALGLSKTQSFFYVIMRPALQKVWPALMSQIVIVMLGTAVCSQIAAEELTYAANFIQGRNFRSFETYVVTALLYLGLAFVIRYALKLFGRFVISRRKN